MLLLVDNFDSFTYNIVHALEAVGALVKVCHNNTSLDVALDPFPTHVIIGPGPGTPSQAGIAKAVFQKALGKIPILGICLGHQLIGEYFGGKLVRAKRPMHGKVSSIYHEGKGVFANLPTPFLATRYHSLILNAHSLPIDLELTAQTESGEVMGIRHKYLPVEGVQFHPDSVASEHGAKIFKYFIGKK